MKRSSRRRLRVVLFGAALFALVGFFVLPPIVRSQLEKRLAAELGRPVRVERVRLNPFALSMTVENLDVREKDGRASFVGWQRLYVNFEALASLTGDWVLGKVELDGFHAAVAVKSDGAFNFADILERLRPPAGAGDPKVSAKRPRPVRLNSVKVTDARVDFSDASRAHPFTTVLGPLTFSLTEFRTVGERGAPYHFAATTEAGEKLAWTGTLAADPLSSVGEFAVENLVLKKYAPYFENRVPADVTSGTLTVKGRYQADLDPAKRVLKLTGGEAHLRDFHVNERVGGPSVIDLPALDIIGMQADALALKASVAQVSVLGGKIAVRREKDGSINLLALVADAETPPPITVPGVPAAVSPATGAAASAKPGPALTFNLQDFSLKHFNVAVTDLATPRAAQLALNDLQVSAKNLSLADGAVMPIAAAFNWGSEGKVEVGGDVTLRPALAAKLNVDLDALEILPLSSYLEQFINARITQGTVSTLSEVQLEWQDGKPAITVNGAVTMARLGLVDGVRNEELAGFERLALTGLKVTTAPSLAVALDQLSVVGPYSRVVVNRDQSLNLAMIMHAPNERNATPATPNLPTSPISATAAPKIAIARVILENGDFSFADNSVEPHLRVALNQFGGTIKGLSSENLARGEVDLKGLVDGAGPVALTGKLDPLGPAKFVDLQIDCKNVDLVPFSPYTGKFAGYELARGKLVVDSKILLDDQKIDATNVVTLHQFTFGAATNSPEATSLPVRLGVALLKDSDGKIVIDLPIQGTLSDPNFRIGKVVSRVIVNLLTKAATSPFSMLGAMFGGGGDELAFQEFTPGSSELQATEAAKLETLIKALANRPALSLGMEGSYDTATDTHALQQQKLANRLRRQIWETKRAANPNIPPPDQLVIEPAELAAAVKKIYDETFPANSDAEAPSSAPAPAVATPVEGPRIGFFTRLLNALTGRDRRTTQTAKAKQAPPMIEAPKVVTILNEVQLPLDEMTERLAEKTEVTADDLRALAAERVQRVRDRLIAGNVAADRLFLTQAKDATNENQGPRVLLTLQ